MYSIYFLSNHKGKNVIKSDVILSLSIKKILTVRKYSILESFINRNLFYITL